MLMVKMKLVMMNENAFIHTIGRLGRGNLRSTFVTIYKHCGIKQPLLKPSSKPDNYQLLTCATL